MNQASNNFLDLCARLYEHSYSSLCDIPVSDLTRDLPSAFALKKEAKNATDNEESSTVEYEV